MCRLAAASFGCFNAPLAAVVDATCGTAAALIALVSRASALDAAACAALSTAVLIAFAAAALVTALAVPAAPSPSPWPLPPLSASRPSTPPRDRASSTQRHIAFQPAATATAAPRRPPSPIRPFHCACRPTSHGCAMAFAAAAGGLARHAGLSAGCGATGFIVPTTSWPQFKRAYETCMHDESARGASAEDAREGGASRASASLVAHEYA